MSTFSLRKDGGKWGELVSKIPSVLTYESLRCDSFATRVLEQGTEGASEKDFQMTLVQYRVTL